MQTLTLKIKDIEFLNNVQKKLISRKSLTSTQQDALSVFLAHLPATEKLLSERVSLDETFEIKILDMKEMWPHLNKWLDLFNSLPKNGHSHYPYACWLDADESPELTAKNVVIEVVFVPSLAYSKRDFDGDKTIDIHLKTDGTAAFALRTLEDTDNFPELYNFSGSWKEAYLLTVKTLQQGWPQTTFPKEFEQFL